MRTLLIFALVTTGFGAESTPSKQAPDATVPAELSSEFFAADLQLIRAQTAKEVILAEIVKFCGDRTPQVAEKGKIVCVGKVESKREKEDTGGK